MNYDIIDMFGIKGDVAIVTGATGGIGKEIALALAQVGCLVVLADINKDLLEKTKLEFVEKDLDVISVVTDVTKKDDVEKMANTTMKRYGKIDILVNCAGVAVMQESKDFNLDKWEFVMDVNVKGTMLSCQAVGKHMLDQKSGRIVNFSSVRGLQGKGGYLAYAPSKGAVNMLTKTLAVEWAKDNINVNAIAPIFTLTEMNKKILDDKKTYDWVISRIPKGKLCEKSFLVGPVIFLCSKASEFITGEIMYVDGGWSAG